MKKAYDDFSMFSKLQIKNFILANGCENAAKIIIHALRPASISWAYPNWSMIDVICHQIKSKSLKVPFYAKDDVIYEPKLRGRFRYHTLNFNNWFKHHQPDLSVYKSGIDIIDISYESLASIKKMLQSFDVNGNIILICSLGK